MNRNVIYYIDEAEVDLRTNGESLKELLKDTGITVTSQLPYRTPADYDPIVAKASTAAFILDQRMKGSGLANYSGTDLAAHLLSIDPKMPIYILTGYANERDEFRGVEYRVEYIIDKTEIRDITAETAQTFKARILRRIAVFSNVLNEREQRFHDLLLKSLNEQLSDGEQEEMSQIEGESTAPILAAERNRERELTEQVDQLRKLLQGL